MKCRARFLTVLAFAGASLCAFGAPSGGALSISLQVQNAGPRQVEESTEKAVARDYAAAWQAMAKVLDENDAQAATANFVGTAAEKLAKTIEAQKKAGLHRRYIDRGHKVQAVFYSPEGSAIELHDDAQLQMQLLDGSKVISSEDLTAHYVVLMTAAADSWKVRVLQQVPSF